MHPASIAALPAGLLFMARPDGSAVKVSIMLLEGSPFRDYFIPGLFLFVVLGVFNLAASFLAFMDFRYTWILGIGFGTIMITWIMKQIWIIGLIFFLQPVFLIVGIIEVILGGIIFKKGSTGEKINDNS